MFIQFLQTQANVQLSQASNINSECIPDPKVFTGEEFSVEQIH